MPQAMFVGYCRSSTSRQTLGIDVQRLAIESEPTRALARQRATGGPGRIDWVTPIVVHPVARAKLQSDMRFLRAFF
jgi:hypothetical protein